MASLKDIVFNPSFDEEEDKKISSVKTNGIVHLKLQQRSARKCITIIEGLAEDLDFKKIAQALRQSYNASCAVIETEKNGTVLQMSGDQRQNVLQFLTVTNICTKEQIKVHGV